MSKKDEVFDKKTKEQYRDEILKEINEKYRPQIVQDIVSDVKKSFDTEYKDQIKNEIKEDIKEDIKKDIQKEQKRLSRSKSFKIFRLYIYLFAVIACAIFLIYRLYETDNLDVINDRYTTTTSGEEVTTIVETTTTTTELVKDLAYYENEYGYLLNKVNITNYELLKGTYEVASISLSDRLAMAYLNLNEEDIIVEDTIYTVASETLSNAYTDLFGINVEYQTSSFTVNGLNYVYQASRNAYMAIGTENQDTPAASNYIVNINEGENTIVFETKAYVEKNGGIYNINYLSYRLMSSENADISKIVNRLTTINYTFTLENDNYVLTSIEKK